MENIRLSPAEQVTTKPACCRCGDGSRRWDRIAGRTYCPQCIEQLATGESDAIIEKCEQRRCAVCHHLGTVRYLTFPLHSRRPIEFDLCSEHLRSLIGRRLGPHAYEQLRRKLTALGINTSDVFLLHEAFYDSHGRASQPVSEWLF